MRLCRLRRETAFSPESTAGSSEAKFNGSPFCVSGRGADRRWGFGASCGLKVSEETGRLSPPQSVTTFRLSSMMTGRCAPDYIQGSRIVRFAQNNCSLKSLLYPVFILQLQILNKGSVPPSPARIRALLKRWLGSPRNGNFNHHTVLKNSYRRIKLKRHLLGKFQIHQAVRHTHSSMDSEYC